MKRDFHNLDLLLNTKVSEIIQPPSANKPPPSAHIQQPQPAHQQPPPPAAQDDLLPLDLSMKSANTTPTAQKPEVNDENLDDVDDNQNPDDVDDNQNLDVDDVVIDGVHEVMMTC